MDIKGFAIQNERSKESLAINCYGLIHNIPTKIVENPKQIPKDYIPSGSVEWCSKILNKHITPDYYPLFLKPYLFRNIWQTNEWPLGKCVFIKPADHYKRFTGFVTNGGYRKKKRGPYWCSDVVRFGNEWRYYVVYGKVLTGEWYSGDEINTPDAPKLDIDIPKEYCGAIDFGILKTGEFALVEANHPFACGWYGKNHELYVEWLAEGWKYMLK